MKEETIEKVRKELTGWAYLEELPDSWHGFTLRKIGEPAGDCYDIFTYESEALHKSATAYYHEETHEYKLRIKIGLIELCRIEFITADFAVFESLLRSQLESLLASTRRVSRASCARRRFSRGRRAVSFQRHSMAFRSSSGRPIPSRSTTALTSSSTTSTSRSRAA